MRKRPVNNPFKVVQMFEEEIANYTGAPFAVSVDSCTNALFLSVHYCKQQLGKSDITIPAKTYLSVPQSIVHAGCGVVFDKSVEINNWKGIYQLKPYPVFDSAKRFTSGMYVPDTFMCLSFHVKKHLGLGKGGMILTDNEDAVRWFKKARYEGRNEVNYVDDDIDMLGWNMYMTPQIATHGLSLMQNFPLHTEDLEENGGYRDLTGFTVFKDFPTING